MTRTTRTLVGALDFVSGEAERWVLDAIYCDIFNKAGDLEGNTAEHDVDWFARGLWGEVHPCLPSHQWDSLSVEQRDYWLRLARASLALLPGLMERIAARCRVQAEALRSLLWADGLRQRADEDGESSREASGAN